MQSFKHQRQTDDDDLIDDVDTDELDEASRAELERELESSLDEADAGQLIDAAEVIAHLRAIRAGTTHVKSDA